MLYLPTDRHPGSSSVGAIVKLTGGMRVGALVSSSVGAMVSLTGGIRVGSVVPGSVALIEGAGVDAVSRGASDASGIS